MKIKQHFLFRSAAMTLGIFLLILMGFLLNRPPAVIPADAKEDLFSAERAAWHLSQIASEKHPLGSQAHREVGEYLIQQIEYLGLTPEVHQTEYYDPQLQRAANLTNILARIPGTSQGKAVMFMGHYDSVEDAYGASDNGSAVVTMLEVIRMLEHHPPLKNDLIFFFPDGEEWGLLGAKAFIEEHPWANDIGAVINLEARGTKGQSFMFETGADNHDMIREFAKAVPYPKANSISMEVYQRMPNDTDFSPFIQKGHQGLNFAYIDNSFDYHTPGDNIENTSLRSIQHHGSHAAALALHLGNHSLEFDTKEDAIYFNTIRYGFISYSYKQMIALSLLVVILVLLVLVWGVYKRHLAPLRMFYGFLAFAIHILLVFVIFNALFTKLTGWYPDGSFRLLEYNHGGILLGFSLLAVGFSMTYYTLIKQGGKIWQLILMPLLAIVLLWWTGELSWLRVGIGLVVTAWMAFAYRKPTPVWSLASGAVVFWTIMLVLVSFKLPGASYLLTWPLLFHMVPLGVIMLKKPTQEFGGITALLFLAFAIPVLIWFSELMYLFHIAMGLNMLGFTLVIFALAVGLLIPLFDSITRTKAWIIPGAISLIGAVFLLTNTIGLSYDERHRKQHNIMYATQANTGKSWWISTDARPDAWTKQFLTENPESGSIKEFYPFYTGTVLKNQSSGPALEPPVLQVLQDTIILNRRQLKLLIQTPENINRISFYFDTGEGETSIRVGELEEQSIQTLGNTPWRRVLYLAPSEKGVELTLFTMPGHPIKMQLTQVDASGIPDFINYAPRPKHKMPQREQSMVSKSYTF